MNPLSIINTFSTDHQPAIRDLLARIQKHSPKDDLCTPSTRFLRAISTCLSHIESDPILTQSGLSMLTSACHHSLSADTHLSFPFILMQLSTDEGRLLSTCFQNKQLEYPYIDLYLKTDTDTHQLVTRHISDLVIEARCDHPDLVPLYLENLARLGLIQIDPTTALTNDSRYTAILTMPLVQTLSERIHADGQSLHYNKGLFAISSIGMLFCNAISVELPTK